MALNASGEINPVTGEPDDWMEIYNGGDEMVDLFNFYLSDDHDKVLKWKPPPGMSLPSGDYLLVWADGSDQSASGVSFPFHPGYLQGQDYSR